MCCLLSAGCASTGSFAGRQALPSVPGSYHRVSRGETLWSIARRYQVELDDLVSVNRLPDAARVSAGQLIFIPRLPASVEESREAAAPRLPTGSADEFAWPVRGKVVSTFGARLYGAVNRGIDIRGAPLSPVVAARAGRVVFLDDRFGSYGRTLILDHGDGLMTVYAGVGQVLVSLGQAVEQRTPIARLDDGASTPLHFEIRDRARAHNPYYYLSAVR